MCDDMPKELEEITSIAIEQDSNDPDYEARTRPDDSDEEIVTIDFEYDEAKLKELYEPGKGTHGVRNRTMFTITITHELNNVWREKFPMQRGKGVGSVAAELAMRMFLAVVYDYEMSEITENLIEFAADRDSALELSCRLNRLAHNLDIALLRE